MKRRIILSLLTIFLFFSIGAAVALIYMAHVASGFNHVIEMHQVEQLRRDLLLNTQLVQTSLYGVHTPLAEELDSIVEHVFRLEESAKTCTSCHHPPGLSNQISEIQFLIKDYEEKLSFYITTRANSRRARNVQAEAVKTGGRLLEIVGDMSHRASDSIDAEKKVLMQRIAKVKWVLFITVTLTFCLGILVATILTRSVTRPVEQLVNATRMITSGNLGSTISYKDNTEFGELAGHFNNMSIAVKDGYEKIQDEISERLQVQSKLMKSEKFLSTIFESIRDPFCILDRNYNIVRANEAYAEMQGLAIQDLVGKVCYEVLHGRDAVCDNCVVEKSLKSTDPCAKEKVFISEDDQKIWYEIYTYPIFNERGIVSHIIEYTRDITDRKVTEEALKASEQRYTLAANGANDGLWDWSLESDVTYFSPRWKAIVGFVNNEISHKSDEWLKRVHADDRVHLENALSAHIEGRTPHFRSEHRILHKDGSYIWVLSRGLSVHDSSGKAYRIAGSMTDITERKQAEEQLIFDALHDSLTALPNRTLFVDRLTHTVGREKRNKGALFAVLALDMDRFKVVNDSLGHTTGDKLLIAVSERLAKSLRPGDTLARIGGDEFSVLLEDLKNRGEAVSIAERIQDQLEQPFDVNGKEIYTSISIGIAFSSSEYDQPEHLLRNADIAMYHAKTAGNSRYAVFDTGMYTNAVGRLQLETDLRQAIKEKDFCLHYQPIVSMKKGTIVGFEALVRWQHRDRGLIYPSQFIHIAEETGLIRELGQWILQESCRQLKVWQSWLPGGIPLTVSVNISSKQLLPNFVDKIKHTLKDTGLAPGGLVLEITESIIMENAELIAPMLTKLKELDVKIHIDDFGTGYSSLSYLHQFPFDVLKIDQSFVQRLDKSGENLEIVKAIITLANSLNMDVIAEGVETESQLLLLQELGCQHMQGHMICRPLDAKDTKAPLSRRKYDFSALLPG
jgi:diguanylate cyclase (GGDEF)-like protein/PAS domain S-box-containing protein